MKNNTAIVIAVILICITVVFYGHRIIENQRIIAGGIKDVLVAIDN